MSDTALDIIKGALRRMNEYAAGETLNDDDANDALSVLTDLLDSLSNEHLACYSRVENVFNLTSGKNIYTVGNPVGGTMLGTVVSGSAIISGVTAMPANLKVGASVSGSGIAAGATVTAIGTNTVTMSANATATYAVLFPITYTTPGDIPINRPLRVLTGFTRLTTSGISQVDYPMQVISVDQWSAIGLKNQPGPWPKVVYYDASYPLGTFYFFPNPSQGGEVHLWTDVLFSDYPSLTTPINLPQGYERFLKVALAIELWPEYKGSAPIAPALIEQYKVAKAAVKNLNAQAQSVATYDHAIAGRAHNDAGWILHGGFN
jgi:hypothetical protein